MYCTKCGLKNEDNAEFCTNCGTKLNLKESKTTVEDINTHIKKVGAKIEQVAEDFGTAAEKFGKQIEDTMQKTSKNFEHWYDKKFGIFGPLVWSFLGIIILRLIIGVLAISGEELSVMQKVSDFLYDYFLLFFGIMIVSSYNTYFYRKYKNQYHWISPLISTGIFIVIIWIIAQMLLLIDTEISIPILTAIATFIVTYLIVIFVIIVILSYTYLLVILPFAKEMK